MNQASFEAQVEQLGSLILKTDAEFWDVRNKSILSLTSLVAQWEGYQNIENIITVNIFRLLREPIVDMLSDLRSQQVRDTCVLLTKLSEVTGDHMKYLLREIFQNLIDGVKVKNRVMSGFVDGCIVSIIKNTTFKSGIPILINELKINKSKFVRERILEYLNEILVYWEINEKEADMITDAIKIGLEDASVTAREVSRCAYLHMYQLYPKKCDKIKHSLSATLRNRLLREEEKFIQRNLESSSSRKSINYIKNSYDNHGNQSNDIPNAPVTPIVTKTEKKKKKVEDPIPSVTIQDITIKPPARLSSLTAMSTDDIEGIIKDAEDYNNVEDCVHHSNTPNGPSITKTSSVTTSARIHEKPLNNFKNREQKKEEEEETVVKDDEELDNKGLSISRPIVQLRIQRPSILDSAAIPIQALIRGNLSRKSVLLNMKLNKSTVPISPMKSPNHGQLSVTNDQWPTYESKENKSSTNSSEYSQIQDSARLSDNCISHKLARFGIDPNTQESKEKLQTYSSQFSDSPNRNKSNIRIDLSGYPSLGQISESDSVPNGNQDISKLPKPLSQNSKLQQTMSHRTSTKMYLGMMNSTILNEHLQNRYESLEISPKSTKSNDEAPNFTIPLGTRVNLKLKDPQIIGIVRYTGFTDFAPGYWVGLELNGPYGKNDGCVQKLRYFSCPPSCGIFVRASQLIFIEDDANKRTVDIDGTVQDVEDEPVDRTKSFDNPSESAVDAYMKDLNLQSVDLLKSSYTEEVSLLLKMKITRLMDIINEQLQIAESMDGAKTLRQSSRNLSSSRSTETRLLDENLIRQLMLLGERESRVNEEFNSELRRIFKKSDDCLS